MSDPILVAVAHGSRRSSAQEQVARLLAAVRAARPGLDVREAYLELARPLLPEALRSAAGPAVIVPLLLGNGYHIAHDVAGVASAYRPGMACAPALGPHPLLAEALAERLREVEGDTASGPVVLAGAGSSDPRSHADARAMAALLATRLGRTVVAAHSSAAGPTLAATVAALRCGGRPVSVASYLLWPGRFAAEVHSCGADFVAPPIGAHPALVQLVLARYDAARAGQVAGHVLA